MAGEDRLQEELNRQVVDSGEQDEIEDPELF